MNPLRIIVLVVAIGAAGMAALLLGGFFGKRSEATAAAGPAVAMTEVLVASTDLEVGTAVKAENLAWQKWPKDAVSPAFITKDANPAALEDMIGAVARTTIFAGEPATDTKMVKAETSSFMAAVLTPGMRAVSVEISEETGAGGFILPNDRVDVIVTIDAGNDEGGAKRVMSRTLLQNIRILAVGQTFRDNAAGEASEDSKTLSAKTATLEVSPAEAELIEHAARGGKLSLTLRGLTGADTPIATLRVPQDQSGRQRSGSTITIIRYGEASQVPAAAN
jgi:pilus assembly protein CpaB